jgi:acetylornithine deacetylase/succinyl-diaminopimelate desuccinylase-like protein
MRDLMDRPAGRRLPRLAAGLCLLVLAASASGGRLAVSSERAADPDFREAGEEALGHLKALVRLDTSNPPGNEARAANYIADELRKAGLEPRVLESEPGRGSVVVRLKGSGAKRPILILSHIDVVPVERAGWSVPPFEGVVKDGFLWGRGTLDDKGMAAAGLMTMILLAREKPRLARDVVFLAEADEEAGGVHGMDFLLDKHPEIFDAEIALNEGGRVIRDDGGPRYVAVQTTEKIYQDFTLTARGTAGHSSLPAGDNPVDRLARALVRVGEKPFPVALNDTTRAFFKGLAGTLPGEAGPCAARLEDPADGGRCAGVLSAVPNFNAMLRTTCTPTVLKAGYKENVIPSEATANLNCRILPSTDVRRFADDLRALIGDPKVEVKFAQPPRPQPGPSPASGPLYDALVAVAKRMAPKAPLVPYMSPGGTDSQVLRERGIAAYGILPFPIREDDLRTMHANDEKIGLEAFTWGNELLYRVVVEAAR